MPLARTPAAPRDVLVSVQAGGRADEIVATATIVRVGEAAVLRAVAVRDGLRGNGLGTLVTAAATRHALEGGATRVFAFTETAEPFFRSLAFDRVERSDLPPDVADSEHATGACATATALVFDPAPRGERPAPQLERSGRGGGPPP